MKYEEILHYNEWHRMNRVARLLVRAKYEIRKPENWTKGYLHTTSEGRPVLDWKKASKHCALGAVDTASRKSEKLIDAPVSESIRFLDAAVWESGYNRSSLLSFNDSDETTHKQVMEIFNAAIAAAKTKAKMEREAYVNAKA